MKTTILLVSLLLIPALSTADSGTYRDRFGNTTGSWQDNGVPGLKKMISWLRELEASIQKGEFPKWLQPR